MSPSRIAAAFLFVMPAAASLIAADNSPSKKPFGLVLHGGAGVIVRDKLPPELEAQYRAELKKSIDAGYVVLAAGGSALDAVVAAIKPLEDSPLLNAGKGAVLNADGICELDASIVAQLGGDGGVVCIDKEGNIAMPFNTPGMYRGFRLSTGTERVEIFGDKK